MTQEKGLLGNKLSPLTEERSKPKILVVDDEDTIREYLKQLLELNGFEVLEAWYGQQAIDLAKEHKPFLCFIDIDLGRGESGLEICRELRVMAETSQMKIAMLTAMSRYDHEPSSYNCHADVFFTKSEGVSGLIAYAKARAQEHSEKLLCSSKLPPREKSGESTNRTRRMEKCGFFVDPDAKEVWYQDNRVDGFSANQFRILLCLLKHSPAIVNRKVILREVWIDYLVGSRTIDVNIHRIKQLLPSSAAAKIESIPGQGYRITE